MAPYGASTFRSAIVTVDGYGFEFISTPGEGHHFHRKTGVGILINPDTAEINSIRWINALIRANEAVQSWLAICEMLDRFESTDRPSSTQCEVLIKYTVNLVSTEWLTFEDAYIDELAQKLDIVEAAQKVAVEREAAESKAKFEKSYERRRGYVYLLKSADGSYKIGCTKNPDDRLKTFEVKLPHQVEFIALLKTSNMRGYEKDLHRKFTRKRLSGEWFDLDDEDVALIKSLEKDNHKSPWWPDFDGGNRVDAADNQSLQQKDDE